MLMLAIGDVLGYVIPLAFFTAAFFAIRHFSSPRPGAPPAKLKHKTARILYCILAAVVLIWLLSALGVFGTTDSPQGRYRAHCSLPYRLEDLVEVPRSRRGFGGWLARYVCGWHYRHGMR